MEQEIIDFDPFEPLYLLDGNYTQLEMESQPMTDDDWQEWLDND